jgi:hypothetical protein
MRSNILTPRLHWSQSICDRRTRANTAGLTPLEAEIALNIYQDIAQYRYAARMLAKQIESGMKYPLYCISHLDYSHSLYSYSDGKIEHIATTTPHRIKQIAKHYEAYMDDKIDIHVDIWSNYCHGGYMTRRGLTAHYADKVVNRVGIISLSHQSITESGKAAHDARVALRN